MRVISGECKGRPLKAVPGQGTRPTTDKIKESLFNIIGPYFKGGLGLDLYGGSGGLGIEALSRGMDKIIFVDRDAKATEVMKSNLKACGYEEQSEVYKIESHRALKALKKREFAFDLVLLDPPYARQRIADDIKKLDEYGLLNRDVQVVAEHDPSVRLPQAIGNLKKVREENYGSTTISLYRLQGQ
ncbi:16S rRNA (guanine(966)-N(2))-methyltransferase RsmD [Fictibacillus enclensis]|uniref:16S rRNA (guanine(966)-N(2))-methyltransferase RsmD n=1 Tax=Fictibacillus enclensis TaxID=1017270 RepID=UPI0025A02406|nr:16S rRNA (guanine(966)-N(2))-methyltransferase RsmD [Fictibacillus enclensis]MDM5198752.1 16S rRNA (guanine(966)-N(2))-methyltransferase RsmD [Fictibacillus enclensis]